MFFYKPFFVPRVFLWSASKQFNCQKHFYFKLFGLFRHFKQFQTIQFSMSIIFVYIQLNIKTVLFLTIQFRVNSFHIKTVLFQAIQFSISTLYGSIDPSDATTSSQNEPGSNSNKGTLCIPQNSNITGTTPLDCLVSYPGHSLGGSYLSKEVQSVYSAAPADWARICQSLKIDSLILV